MIRIVIADDHAIVREGLKRIVSEIADMQVIGEAADGTEVMQRVRELDFDILVQDLSMPGRSGMELIKLVRAEKPKLRILVLSMHQELQYAVRAIKSGASGYLTKESAPAQLEQAIRKIDRETRARFQDTFDRINNGLKDKFPRLFGGGAAYLELVGDDLLTAGVAVMARPPGKRNSSIHQLSGGEKALTAVALVFSIFELNPAPFCLLDEVDAPLDDANVGRFSEIVKEMSERVQFVFITHNKNTMELAGHLIGVTMGEAGVSRLVAVDVDEAMRMAAVG